MVSLASALGFLVMAQGTEHFSGGALRLEQACYDVRSYDVSLRVDPEERALVGTTVMAGTVVIPTGKIWIDLDDPYSVSGVVGDEGAVRFERLKGGMYVYFPLSKQPGETFKLTTTYSGVPHVAKRAPWDGGFVWAKTKSNADWISVALQGAGADLLFPCKDHPSDRVEEATMRLTVPSELVAVGPGKLISTDKGSDGMTTYTWHMPMPINNYSLVFNAAPYELIRDSGDSVTGESIPIWYYVLPENREKAPQLLVEQKKYLAFMEKYCGPYPFRKVKMGIVDTPHLGMEHSTAIAYGNQYRFAADGYDWLLLHEYGHEWWANLVVNADWRDMWIHEGFQSFMDTFYVEQIRGRDAYLAGMKGRRRNVRNLAPMAPREETSSAAYGGDMYDKGALVLHTLRYLIGEEAFLRSIRRMAYPTVESETWGDGRAMRMVTTDDYLTIASREGGMDLGWFFEAYVRRAALPELKVLVADGVMELSWMVDDGIAFAMPVDVVIDGETRRVIPGLGDKPLRVEFSGEPPVVDPEGWVLRK